jgi:hypothetical protein
MEAELFGHVKKGVGFGHVKKGDHIYIYIYIYIYRERKRERERERSPIALVYNSFTTY